jgi:hypothetical protein
MLHSASRRLIAAEHAARVTTARLAILAGLAHCRTVIDRNRHREEKPRPV